MLLEYWKGVARVSKQRRLKSLKYLTVPLCPWGSRETREWFFGLTLEAEVHGNKMHLPLCGGVFMSWVWPKTRGWNFLPHTTRQILKLDTKIQIWKFCNDVWPNICYERWGNCHRQYMCWTPQWIPENTETCVVQAWMNLLCVSTTTDGLCTKGLL